jgi:hypothetical protein
MPLQNTPSVDAGTAFVYNGFAPCECLGDLNNDGIVNGADLGILLLAWGACPSPPTSCPSDLNGDNQVDGADLGLLLLAWNRCPQGFSGGGGGSAAASSGGEGAGPDGIDFVSLAALVGWSGASEFVAWLSDASEEEVHAIGQTIVNLLGG